MSHTSLSGKTSVRKSVYFIQEQHHMSRLISLQISGSVRCNLQSMLKTYFARFPGILINEKHIAYLDKARDPGPHNHVHWMWRRAHMSPHEIIMHQLRLLWIMLLYPWQNRDRHCPLAELDYWPTLKWTNFLREWGTGSLKKLHNFLFV